MPNVMNVPEDGEIRPLDYELQDEGFDSPF